MAPRKRSTQPQSLTTVAQAATVHPIRPTIKEGTKTVTDFGAPVPVAELPPKVNGGGRTSLTPVYEKWLAQLTPDTWGELASDSEDGAHPVNRVQALRKVAGDAYQVETRPVVPGKRYRIFAKVAS